MDQPSSSRKRTADIAELVTTRGVTKSGVLNLLEKLQSRGLLTAPLLNKSKNRERANLHHATQMQARARTPHGPVAQKIAINSEKLPLWDFIHPMAYLYTLCSVSGHMYELMSSRQTWSVILYADEMHPGNPLHPSPLRKVWCIYWAFAEWPSWMLQRKDAWILFGAIRTTIVKDIPGGISYIMKLVLKVFFSKGPRSFIAGCTIAYNGMSFKITAKLKGLMSDESALSYLFHLKGASGTFPCFSCMNCAYKRAAHATGNVVTITEIVISNFVFRTKAVIKEMLKRLHEETRKTKRAELEKRFGINYVPDGLLYDDYLFDEILDGCDSYFRDPMHTLSSKGVAGIEIARVIQVLNDEVEVEVSTVKQFAHLWKLPKSKGKVSDMYFKDELLCSDHVRHFASDVLGMIHILYAFLVEKILPSGYMTEHIECFSRLHEIITLLRLGGNFQKLDHAIREHARLFKKLYDEDDMKPKFHHLLHLATDLQRLGRVVQCFVTERKHLDIRRLIANNYHSIESSLVCSYYNDMLHNYMDHNEFFLPQYLVDPQTVDGSEHEFSTVATLPCGTIQSCDIVVLVGRSVAEIMDFWMHVQSGTTAARVKKYTAVHGDNTLWKMQLTPSFISVDDIVEAIPYYVPYLQHIRIAPLIDAYV